MKKISRGASPRSGAGSDDEFDVAAKRHQEAMAALLQKRKRLEEEARKRAPKAPKANQPVVIQTEAPPWKSAAENIVQDEPSISAETWAITNEQKRRVHLRHILQDIADLSEEEEPRDREGLTRQERNRWRQIDASEKYERNDISETLKEREKRQQLRDEFSLKQQIRDVEERDRIRQMELEAAAKTKVLREAQRRQLLANIQSDLAILEEEEGLARAANSRIEQEIMDSLLRQARHENEKRHSQDLYVQKLFATIRTLESKLQESERECRDVYHQKDKRIRELEDEVALMKKDFEEVTNSVEESAHLNGFLKQKLLEVAAREAFVVDLENDLNEVSVTLQQEFVAVNTMVKRLRLLVADTNFQVTACVSAARTELQKRQRQFARDLSACINSSISAHQFGELASSAALRGVVDVANATVGHSELAGSFQMVLTEDLQDLLVSHQQEENACLDLAASYKMGVIATSASLAEHPLSSAQIKGPFDNDSWRRCVAIYEECIGRRHPGGTKQSPINIRPSTQITPSVPTTPLLILLPTLVMAGFSWIACVVHFYASTTSALTNVDGCARAINFVASTLLATGIAFIAFGILFL